MRPRLSPWLALPAGLALLVAAVAQQAPLGSVPIVVSLTNLLARLPSSNAPAALVLGATNAFDWGAPRLIVWDAASSATANGSNTWATASGVGRWRWWEVAGSVDLSGYARLDGTNHFTGTITLNAISVGTLELSNAIAMAVGGTGATNAAGARSNLGTDNADNLTSGTVANARLDNDIQRVANITYSTGDILYASASGLTNLGIGSSGQVLKVSGGVPTWGTDNTSAGGTNVFSYDIDANGVTTNDSTAVTLSTTAIARDSGVTVDADVYCFGQTNGASYRLLATYRNAGGTVTTVGTNNLSTIESVSNLHVWPEVSGTNLLIRVKGQTNENMNWYVKGRVLAGALGTNAPAGGGGSYDYREGFEGTGAPSGWSGNLTYDFDNTSSPLVGSQSATYASDGNVGSVVYTFGTGTTNKYFYWTARTPSLTNSAWDNIFQSYDSAFAIVSTVAKVNNTGKVTLEQGSAYVESGTGLLSANTTYHFWFRFASATSGANGIAEMYIATNSTKPGSPTLNITTGSLTNDIKYFIWGPGINPPGGTWKLDDVIIHSSAIGSAP